jgi:hypothetical protein
MQSQGIFLALAVIFSTSITVVDTATALLRNRGPAPIEGVAAADVGKVYPGQVVLVQWDILKRIDCGGENGRVWNGQNGFHVSEALMPTGLPQSAEAKTYIVPTRIPAGAPAGPLSFEIRGTFTCPGSDPIEFRLPTGGPYVFEVGENRGGG